MLVRWLGHATALLAVDGVRLLTDPVLGPRVGPLVRTARPAGPASPGPVDCVLLSHLHLDHADLPSLRRLGRATPIIAPHPSGRWLRRVGFPEVVELRAGEETAVGEVRVIATEARHDARRLPLGPVGDPVGYIVAGSRSAYFAGDTDLFAGMAEWRGQIDLALLPVWGWGRSLGPGHLDPERAATAAATIAPRVAIPIHWGTLALGRRTVADPAWPARKFAAQVAERAPAVDVRVLAPGESTEL
jgi:L-ascorbate metabolism protein UlaG (beta-lactamase superfamily)